VLVVRVQGATRLYVTSPESGLRISEEIVINETYFDIDVSVHYLTMTLAY